MRLLNLLHCILLSYMNLRNLLVLRLIIVYYQSNLSLFFLQPPQNLQQHEPSMIRRNLNSLLCSLLLWLSNLMLQDMIQILHLRIWLKYFLHYYLQLQNQQEHLICLLHLAPSSLKVLSIQQPLSLRTRQVQNKLHQDLFLLPNSFSGLLQDSQQRCFFFR